MLDSKTVDMFPDFLKEVKEQQQPTQQEYAELYRANKADLWLENKKLRASLKQAAEIVAKNYCPANHDCPLEDTECGGGVRGMYNYAGVYKYVPSGVIK